MYSVSLTPNPPTASAGSTNRIQAMLMGRVVLLFETSRNQLLICISSSPGINYPSALYPWKIWTIAVCLNRQKTFARSQGTLFDQLLGRFKLLQYQYVPILSSRRVISCNFYIFLPFGGSTVRLFFSICPCQAQADYILRRSCNHVFQPWNH